MYQMQAKEEIVAKQMLGDLSVLISCNSIILKSANAPFFAP